MSAILSLRNVGGIRGDKELEFKQGKLNEIRGANASGKTSILRAIVATLAIPETGNFEREICKRNAAELGIKSSELGVIEDFVNIHANEATVLLKFANERKEYKVNSSGDILKAPNGDERFLLAGCVMLGSQLFQEIYRTESGVNFGWLIGELSYADNYDAISSQANFKLEEAERLLGHLEETEKEVQNLSEEKKAVERRKEKAENEKDELEEEFDEKIWDKREKLFESQRKLERTIGNKERELRRAEEDVEEYSKKADKAEKDISKLKEKLKENREKRENIQEELESSEEEFKKKKSSLKENVRKIDGEINILQSALYKLDEENISKVNCFLCKQGTLESSSIRKRLDNLKEHKGEERSKIAKLIRSRRGKDNAIRKLEDEEGELKKDIESFLGDLYDCQNKVSESTGIVEPEKRELKEKRKELNKVNQRLRKVREQTKEGTKDELESLEDQIRKMDGKIISMEDKIDSKTRTEIFEEFKVESTEVAKEIYEGWINLLTFIHDFAEQKSSEHREKARKRFNESIENILADLGYKGFKSIWLNRKNQLLVERGDGKESRIQPADSLSLSEKCIVVALLSLSVKESYLPDIPFFIVDDVMQDFDKDKRQKLFDYLERIAEQRDMYILTSVLDPSCPEVEVFLR